MNPIETTNKEECIYHLPCMSPFQNGRPMTPLENIVQGTIHTIENLSDHKKYDIITYILNGSSFELISNIFCSILSNSNSSEFILNIRDFCNNLLSPHVVNHTDEQHENFKSISETKEIQEIEKKIEPIIKNEEEKKDNEENKECDIVDDKNDEDIDQEVSEANSNNSGSDIESDNESDIDSNKQVKSNTVLNTALMIGKITSLVNKKAKITLSDNRVGIFPNNFDYYGKIGNDVRVSIKFENKEKNLLILNFINTQFKKDEEVNGTISINKDITYVNIPGIKKATFPKNFKHTGLKNGMKVSCSIYNTYDYKDNDENVIGLCANLSFISIIS